MELTNLAQGSNVFTLWEIIIIVASAGVVAVAVARAILGENTKKWTWLWAVSILICGTAIGYPIISKIHKDAEAVNVIARDFKSYYGVTLTKDEAQCALDAVRGNPCTLMNASEAELEILILYRLDNKLIAYKDGLPIPGKN